MNRKDKYFMEDLATIENIENETRKTTTTSCRFESSKSGFERIRLPELSSGDLSRQQLSRYGSSFGVEHNP